MRKQDYLSELIQSLSPGEKRYFKIYAGLQPGAKRYMKLYDLLEKEGSYDAAVLSRKLKSDPKKLAHEKDYLQQVLIRALRNFEQDSSVPTVLLHRYLEADMLSKRGLKDFALSHIDKAYKKILDHEQHATFIHAFMLRQRLVHNKVDPSPEFGSYELYKQQMDQHNEIMELEFLYAELIPHMVRRNDKEAMKTIAQKGPLRKKPEELLSARARIIYYTAHIAITTILYGLGTALGYAEQLVTTYEENPFLIQNNPVGYLYSYHRLSVAYSYEEGDRALEALDKALAIADRKAFPLPSKILNQFRFDTLLQKLNLLNGLYRYHKSVDVAREILHHELDPEQEYKRITVIFLYTVALLFTGGGEQALVPLRELLKGNKKGRQDIQLKAMQLELLVHYDLGNYSLIPYQVQSIKKWVKRKGLEAESCALYLTWMLRLSSTGSNGDQKKELMAFSEDVNAGKIKIETGIINLRYWLDEKIKRLR